MDFELTIETTKKFEEAVDAVEKAAAARSFRVLHVHDVKATLEEKGFKREPLKIVEVCNAKYASQSLQADVKVALMLPCPIVVYVEGPKTFISTMRPRVLSEFYPKAGLENIAREVDDAIVAIVREAAGSPAGAMK